VNIEKSNVPQQNLLELIHKFNKLAGYEMNTQKLIACFYINNKQEKKKTKKLRNQTSLHHNMQVEDAD
jgi:hypothetical protein